MKPSFAHLDHERKLQGEYASRAGDHFGAFYFYRGGVTIITLASAGDESMPWEHVSARAIERNGKERVPTWAEMCWLKDQFWNDDECVVQYHPPRSEWVNVHPFVLHLWKPVGIELPRPPIIAV